MMERWIKLIRKCLDNGFDDVRRGNAVLGAGSLEDAAEIFESALLFAERTRNRSLDSASHSGLAVTNARS